MVLLALANLGFLAWAEGWLAGPLALPVDADREPGRLAQQVRPQSLRILPPKPSGTAASAAPAG